MEITRLDQRVVLSLTGEDSVSFLQGLVTNNVDNLEENTSVYAALLMPQGKIISDMIAMRTSNGFLLDVPIQSDEILLKRLKMFKLKAKAEIELKEDLAVYIHMSEGYTDPRHADMPLRSIAELDAKISTNARFYHEHRIQLAVPEQGKDFGENESFPADVNMDLNNGIDFKKGCFVGQEVVSRMKRRSTSRRRTLPFYFPKGAPLPETPIKVGDTRIGEVSSSQSDHALARIRIDRMVKARDADQAPFMAGEKECELISPEWLDEQIEIVASS